MGKANLDNRELDKAIWKLRGKLDRVPPFRYSEILEKAFALIDEIPATFRLESRAKGMWTCYFHGEETGRLAVGSDDTPARAICLAFVDWHKSNNQPLTPHRDENGI